MNEKFKLITHLTTLGVMATTVVVTGLLAVPIKLAALVIVSASFVSVCVATH